ncbi:unnamed protein product [Prunus armeniaca]|uniref:MBD domain-containing protein n=1 Tax=Prunus armeniaca TaxID=36596 RepID=A0A6J5Y9I0_PRUAR|nr:unnamed protein product [Prunus armeniaca]CAB4322101.1 unnamed protein product [Prunus armeniaca]
MRSWQNRLQCAITCQRHQREALQQHTKTMNSPPSIKDYSKLDAYYITPKGKKVRTRNEIAAFLKENPIYEGISASDFDFANLKVMEDTIPEIVGKKGSGSSYKKMRPLKDEEETGSV